MVYLPLPFLNLCFGSSRLADSLNCRFDLVIDAVVPLDLVLPTLTPSNIRNLKMAEERFADLYRGRDIVGLFADLTESDYELVSGLLHL